MNSERPDHWLFETQQSSEDTIFDSLPILTSDTTASPALSDLDAPFEFYDPLIDSISPAQYTSYSIYQQSFPYLPIQEPFGLSSQFPPSPAVTDIDSEEISPLSSPMIPKAEPTSYPPLEGISTTSPTKTNPSRGKENNATSSRRRAQNRRAQRAFRERKERHAKDLEARLTDLTVRFEALARDHEQLARAYKQVTEGKRSKEDSLFEGL